MEISCLHFQNTINSKMKSSQKHTILPIGNCSVKRVRAYRKIIFRNYDCGNLNTTGIKWCGRAPKGE